MAKKIDTAKKETIKLESGTTVIVQELSSMGAFRAANTIKKIVGKARKVGSLDDLMANFRNADSGNLDRLLEAFDMLLTVVGDEPELILNLVASCLVDETKSQWNAETVGELPLTDLVDLMKAVYKVNWVDGSLKKALGKLGMKFEEQGSKSLPETQSEPSESKTAETPSMPVEASIS